MILSNSHVRHFHFKMLQIIYRCPHSSADLSLAGCQAPLPDHTAAPIGLHLLRLSPRGLTSEDGASAPAASTSASASFTGGLGLGGGTVARHVASLVTVVALYGARRRLSKAERRKGQSRVSTANKRSITLAHKLNKNEIGRRIFNPISRFWKLLSIWLCH